MRVLLRKHEILKPLITIVAASSVMRDETLRAIEKTSQELPVPHKWVLVEKGINSIVDYNRVMLQLGDYVALDTDYYLIVQHDGYALNKANWRGEFLEYDYIGAPWPFWFHRKPTLKSLVGNGGFSLRSLKFVNACREASTLNADFRRSEDAFMLLDKASILRDSGCRVAPVDVALRFAQEHRIPEHPFWPDRKSFGFHGKFNWYGGKL